MEQINKSASQQLNPESIINQIQKSTKVVENHSRDLLGNLNGFNALNLIGDTVVADDLLKAEEFIKLNYGIDYQPEKFTMLWELILEDKWTSERLNRTLKWFLKNKRYPNWTIADWFDYQIKLFPYGWYLEQIQKGYKHEDMCAYRINGKIYWKMKDNVDLPFEKIT